MMAHIPQWVVVAFYWIPLALCAAGYTVRTAKDIKRDLNDRHQSDLSPHAYYYPSVTVGADRDPVNQRSRVHWRSWNRYDWPRARRNKQTLDHPIVSYRLAK